jgi:hypothetical protein
MGDSLRELRTRDGRHLCWPPSAFAVSEWTCPLCGEEWHTRRIRRRWRRWERTQETLDG